MVRSTLMVGFSFFLSLVSAQHGEVISLFNPSFEDIPKHSDPPMGWTDCGFPQESPPDVHPSGFFNVYKPPYQGKTYLGMVVRENDTWEMVQQRLPSPIEPNKCYTFSIMLSRSDTYLSGTKASQNTMTKFTNPIKLRIWGGNGYCEKKELLAESPLVKNTEWQKFTFRFEPDQKHQYILFEAFYNTPTLFPYNGNILLDDASDIVLVPCHEEEIASHSTDDKESKRVSYRESAIITPNTRPTSKTSAKPSPPVLNLDRKRINKGSVIGIDKLYFEADSSVIPLECFPVLDEVFHFLKQNQDIIIEIGGHTNSIPKHEYCDRLSLARAKAVASYIADKGIPWRRIYYKGYGKNKPIADDTTQEGKRKNQRVEIKILHMRN